MYIIVSDDDGDALKIFARGRWSWSIAIVLYCGNRLKPAETQWKYLLHASSSIKGKTKDKKSKKI